MLVFKLDGELHLATGIPSRLYTCTPATRHTGGKDQRFAIISSVLFKNHSHCHQIRNFWAANMRALQPLASFSPHFFQLSSEQVYQRSLEYTSVCGHIHTFISKNTLATALVVLELNEASSLGGRDTRLALSTSK